MFATGNYRRDAGTHYTATTGTYLTAITGILYSATVGTITPLSSLKGMEYVNCLNLFPQFKKYYE
nr:hypothetical protein [uncultured Bacteroides sp.]